MVRRVYSICGFDCASCAEKSEAHLAKHPKIESVRLDFLQERLYVTYKDEELAIADLLDTIHEVEGAPIEIAELGQKKEKKDYRTLFLFLRVAYCVLVFLLTGFFFKDLYWVRFSLYVSALLIIEYDIVWKVLQNVIHMRNPLDEYLLISIASIGAFVLASLKHGYEGQARAFGNDVFQMEEHFEAILVCLLWQLGEALQSIAVRRSARSIESAVSSRVSEALLVDGDHTERIDASKLIAGDVVYVNYGMSVPVDGVVLRGQGYCDTSSLTGESVPVALLEGSSVYSGTMLTEGEIIIRATKDYASSSAARILDLINNSLEKKGNAERFITKFARIYTPAIFLVAVVYLLIAGFFGPSWRSAVFTSLEMLVISCPCALVISVPLAYFASLGKASKQGILIKGASYLDELLRVKTLVTDKTGTLTKGEFAVKSFHHAEDIDAKEVESILVSLESVSSHPLAKAIVRYFVQAKQREVTDFQIIPGLGVQGKVEGKLYYAGSHAFLEKHELEAPKSKSGVDIFLFDEQRILGEINMEDSLKENSKKMVKSLQNDGIFVKIFSGDTMDNTQSVAEAVGADEYRGGLLPEEKLSLLEGEKRKANGAVCFLGDGVNDAPALARADIGVAMGGLGADLAIEEADVLLLRDDPIALVEARKVAKRCRAAIIANIAFALLVKAVVMVLAVTLHEKLPMEVAVLSDTGVSVICILNSLLLLRRKK